MKKCPDQETLSLFVDHELEEKELGRLRQHLEKCARCRAEVQMISSSESLLRAGIDEAFARHRSAAKILEEIRKTPAAAPAPEKKSWWQLLSVRFAVVFVVLVLVWSMFSARPQYHGTVMSVAFQALNNDSMVDGARFAPHEKFVFSRPASVALEGKFLFTLVATQTTEFTMHGKAEAVLNEASLPDFKNAEIELLWVSGPAVDLNVNARLVQLSKKPDAALPIQAVCSTDATSTQRLESSNGFASDSLEIHGIIDSGSQSVDIKTSETVPNASRSVTIQPIPQIQPEENPDFNKNPFSEEPLDISGN